MFDSDSRVLEYIVRGPQSSVSGNIYFNMSQEVKHLIQLRRFGEPQIQNVGLQFTV